MEQVMTKKAFDVKALVSAALCIALGVALPQIFHMIPVANAGSVLCPMHIPVLLCGFICGWQYGLVCGIAVPLLSSVITGMPPLFPVALCMVFELAAYGLLAGIFYRVLKWNEYVALIAAMLGGRVVMGISSAIIYGAAGKGYGFQAFLSGAFITALPGIIIQIVLIPVLVFALKKAKLFTK